MLALIQFMRWNVNWIRHTQQEAELEFKSDWQEDKLQLIQHKCRDKHKSLNKLLLLLNNHAYFLPGMYK